MIEEITMKNTTRSTRAAASRVTRTEFDSLKGDVAQILALLTGESKSAPAAKKATAKKASKATSKKAAPATTATKCVTRKTRPAFVKANPQFGGQSTSAIQQALHAGASFEGNWTLGERTVEFLETGAYPATAPKAAKAKGSKKGKKATKVVAEVKAASKAKAAPKARTEEPEYGTEAWIAWARPTDDGAPRRANGTVAPKAEWATRIALEATGKFDRHEVDAVLANA